MFKPMFKITAVLAAALMSAGMVSCSSDDDVAIAAGKALVAFDIKPDSKFSSRALNEGDWRDVSNYTVEIKDANGEVIQSCKGNELPSALELEAGNYTVHAFYGEEQVASRSQFLSEGIEQFSLNLKDEKQVKVTCTPTCGKVMVNFGADMAKYFDDYYVTLSTPKMDKGLGATWAKDDTEAWYLAVGENGDNVTATIHLKANAKYAADKNAGEDWSEGTVTLTYALHRNQAWVLNINPEYTSSAGELGVSVSIDDSTNDQTVDVVIPSEWI